MKPFRVWIRPLGDFCRVRVDGMDNVQWLLSQLSPSFVFRTFEPIEEIQGTTLCVFQVPCNLPLTQVGFRKLLMRIPQVQLMQEPA